jgi:hypothetical protein
MRLARFGEELIDASGAAPPQLLERVEEAGRSAERLGIGMHDLLPPAPFLRNERSSFEHRDVFLHRRETHGVVPCELRDRLLPQH